MNYNLAYHCALRNVLALGFMVFRNPEHMLTCAVHDYMYWRENCVKA